MQIFLPSWEDGFWEARDSQEGGAEQPMSKDLEDGLYKMTHEYDCTNILLIFHLSMILNRIWQIVLYLKKNLENFPEEPIL